jgi:hypothetical protein
MLRIAFPIFALAVALMLAVLFASIAHDGLGIPRATIRANALTGAAFMSLVLALGAILKRNR